MSLLLVQSVIQFMAEIKHNYMTCYFTLHRSLNAPADAPDFSEHTAGLQCDKHNTVVRSSHHLHRSTFNDVHLLTDVTLQGGGLGIGCR